MANEFKVRKGLIVEGSGSAILDIQGSQGQLFSITDDLTGDIFSVSDISGVPILNVNADGTTTITGAVSSSLDGIRSEGTIRSDTSVMGMESILSRDITVGRSLIFSGSPIAGSGTKALMFVGTGAGVQYRTLGSNAFNSTSFTTNTGTLTGNGSSGRVPIYNGTTSFTTDTGFTYSSNILSIDGVLRANGVPIIDHTTSRTLLIGDTNDSDEIDAIKFIVMASANIVLEDGETAINSALKLPSMPNQSSEATSLMINGSGIVGTRELGSNAFNSTTIPSAANNATITLSGGTGIDSIGSFSVNTAMGTTLTINLSNDRRKNSSGTDVYTGNTHDYVFFDASHGQRFYTSGAEEMRLENDGDLHVDGDIIAFSSTVSDERLKDNVTTIENPLDKIKALRGVEYDWNDGSRKGKHDLGLIAQEVEKVLPNIVHEHQMPLLNDDEEDETLYKTVDYEKLTAVLIEGMKEQQSQIDELKSELAKIKGSL